LKTHHGRARIALVGTGWWATYAHLPALSSRADVELVALANRGTEKLRLAAEAFNVRKTYEDYLELLDKEMIDGLVIAASHEAHYSIAKAALEHDCHLLIEKPMVLKSAEAHELIHLAKVKGRIITISYPWGFTARVRRARQAVLGGEIGEIQLVSSLYTSFAQVSYRGDPEAFDELYDSDIFKGTLVRPRLDGNIDPQRGGGQWHCQVTHSAGLVFWVTGLSARRVSADMICLGLPVDVIDSATVRLSNGAIGTICSSGNLQVGDPGQHALWVYGSSGYLNLDMIAGTLSIHKKDGLVETHDALPEEGRYPRFAPANGFVDAILYGAENMAPGEIGQMAVDFLEAAHRSALNEGTPIDVEPRHQD
jgi:predicted dehydrogenase